MTWFSKNKGSLTFAPSLLRTEVPGFSRKMDPGRQNCGAEALSAGLIQKNNNRTKDAEMDEGTILPWAPSPLTGNRLFLRQIITGLRRNT